MVYMSAVDLTTGATQRTASAFEGIERFPPLPVGEEPEVGAGAAVAVAHHEVPRDRLEAGAEVLAGLDEDVPLAARVDR